MKDSISMTANVSNRALRIYEKSFETQTILSLDGIKTFQIMQSFRQYNTFAESGHELTDVSN